MLYIRSVLERVSYSYIDPLKTWNTNTLGTINILESIRKLKNKCNIIIITSDKCYRNFEVSRGYKETDLLGGNDPYGASKAAAEIAIKSYFESFLKEKPNLRIANARAGNVIGGGDWTPNRLIPDCVKSLSKNKKPFIRNPNATRPWQHVLEVIYGYLLLSIKVFMPITVLDKEPLSIVLLQPISTLSLIITIPI